MTKRTTRGLALELSRDLAPVRRIPRLRTVAGMAVAVWALGFAAHAALGGPVPIFGSPRIWGNPLYLLVLVGMCCAAGGGLAYAFASAVPGREAAARWGARSLALGIGLAAGSALVAWSLISGGPEVIASKEPSLPCLARALLLGVLPGLVAFGFAVWAFAVHPVRTALVAALAAVSLGAVAVHTSCESCGPAHLLLGHTLGPLAVALLLALPAAGWLRRIEIGD